MRKPIALSIFDIAAVFFRIIISVCFRWPPVSELMPALYVFSFHIRSFLVIFIASHLIHITPSYLFPKPY